MSRGEAHFIQEVSGPYTSPFLHTDEQTMALRVRKVSGTFEKRAPGDVFFTSFTTTFTIDPECLVCNDDDDDDVDDDDDDLDFLLR